MGDSLREQMLQAGLISAAQAKKAEREQKRDGRQGRQRKKAGKTDESEAAKAEKRKRLEAEKAAQAERDRELNAKREARRLAREKRQQVHLLLKKNRKNDDKAGIRHHYVDGKAVRQIYVTAAQQQALGRGELAIVRFVNRQFLVPTEIADRVAAVDPELSIIRDFADRSSDDGEHQIPDDFTW